MSEVAVIKPSEITDSVLNKVNLMQEQGQLIIPQNYAAANALKSASLILQETMTKNNVCVLEACTQTSIANCLLDMVKMGLEPSKKQCYFVAYGNKLQLMTSYFGKLAIAKRVSDLKDVKAFVIYEGDEFETEFDLDTLEMKIKSYKPNVANVNLEKIKGAFAVPIFKDGSKGDVVYMSIQQIKNSWNQGYAKGNSGAHKNFTDEMAKKTIITRVCKMLINASDDGDLIDTYGQAEEEHTPQEEQKEFVGTEEFIEAEIVEESHDTHLNSQNVDSESQKPQEKAQDVQVTLDDTCPM
nr:RecT family recombinase [uncultured Cellulosilyticum sp.]